MYFLVRFENQAKPLFFLKFKPEPGQKMFKSHRNCYMDSLDFLLDIYIFLYIV